MASQFTRDSCVARLRSMAFVIGIALVIAYFIYFAGGGVRAYFSEDDLMNMHDALVRGTLSQHVARSMLFFLPGYRPVGASLYRFTYDVAGLNPLLLHFVCVSLALLNVGLLFLVTSKIGRSVEIGLLSALMGAFHGNLLPLYYDSGNCYDLLSFAFYCSGLFMYVAIRQRNLIPRGLATATLLLLFVIALGAKEIAVSFPVILFAYELLWHPPRTIRSVGSWAVQQGRTALFCAVIVIVYTAARVYGPGGLAYIGAYQPNYSLTAYLDQLGRCMNEVFYTNDYFTHSKTVLFWAGLMTLAIVIRSRYLVFCVILTLIGFLPIAFIAPRSLCAAYVPWIGFWGYMGGVLISARMRLAAGIGNHSLTILAVQLALFVVALVALTTIHMRHSALPEWIKNNTEIRRVVTQLTDMHLRLPRGAHVLIVQDPFRDWEWGRWHTVFIFRLFYHDPALNVEQCSDVRTEDGRECSAVLTSEKGLLSRISGCDCRTCCPNNSLQLNHWHK